MFDILYSLEYVVLLAFGFSSEVKEFEGQKKKPIFITVILVLSFLALSLKLIYYTCMHVWNNVIISGKKLIRREFTVMEERENRNIQSKFFKVQQKSSWCPLNGVLLFNRLLI